jgi:hypothetical protein
MYKKNLTTLFTTLGVLFLSSTLAYAANGELTSKITNLGFSSELVSELNNTNLELTDKVSPTTFQTKRDITEADAVQEQLTQLGNTRNLSSIQQLNAEEIRLRVSKYWSKNGIRAAEIKPVKHELMQEVQSAIRTGLEAQGYGILKLVLEPTSVENVMRGDIRVERRVVPGTAYRQIQGNLAEVKEICLESATIKGVCYLSEMTTFIVENPQNKYYYERTILK